MNFSKPRLHSQPLQRSFSFISPRTADILKGVLAKVDELKSHNQYPDLTNAWAPSANPRKSKWPKAFQKSAALGVLLLLAWMLVGREAPQVQTKVRVVEVLQSVYAPEDTQLINYAADFNGATILSSSPPIHGVFSRLSSNNDVSLLLSESTEPGNCWGFYGSSGYAEVRLARSIQVTKFSMKHVNVRARQHLTYSNAPQHFEVYGDSSFLSQCLLLGSYKFHFSVEGDSRRPTQVFSCQDAK
jgi:hypothetical protein